MLRFLIFSDLDGTLLDHHTYAWTPARPALRLMDETDTPLVLVSSKTRVEIESLRIELGNRHPFIPENGGAIFIPAGYPLDPPPAAVDLAPYRAVILGRRVEEIAIAFDRLAERLPVRALSRLDPVEVAALTGLTIEQARAARGREFGEAFLLDDPGIPESELVREVEALGLRLTRGGRFYHLLGENDKGRAVRMLADMYRQRQSPLITAACGDAPNDAPMLAAVDRPFLVARPDGSHAPMDVPGMVRVPLPGPAGFNQAVTGLLAGPSSGIDS
ncbi:MAG: HAD-IIB family hydrolase [Proteobacteria bacterium]|nr:HAD-IIB family hydrolase [Pseudomonadota bacterium]